jgi:lipopolysaccharide transport protein LptA
LPAIALLLSFQAVMLSADQAFSISSEDMVAIHADEAWEDIDPDIAHFSGHFDMRVRDLQLTADRATLYGPIENPDRLELSGSPARLSLTHMLNDRPETVNAEAQNIIYERKAASMRLDGAARLAQGDNMLLSDGIEYDVKTDRFHTTGRSGVQIRVRPQKN